jgi:hypothetical protein
MSRIERGIDMTYVYSHSTNANSSAYAVNAASTWSNNLAVSSTAMPNAIHWNAGVTCDKSFAIDTFLRNVKVSDQLIRGMIIDLPAFKSMILMLSVSFQILSEGFIEDFYNDLTKDDRHNMCICQKLSIEFIERHPDLLDDKECAEAISIFQELNQRFMSKHASKLEWDALSGNQSMSIPFIRKNIDKVRLDKLLVRQQYDDDFINRVLSEFDCHDIRDSSLVLSAMSWHHDLTEENIRDYIDMVDFHSPKLCDREFDDPSISAYRCILCGASGK